jgi:hypothetical protein
VIGDDESISSEMGAVECLVHHWGERVEKRKRYCAWNREWHRSVHCVIFICIPGL